MHDIWNPWHGCKKKSEGCKNCYMYFLDSQRGKSGAEIYRVKNNFNYPIQKDKNGKYKIKSGEYLRVCMTSDFFLEEADAWRDEAWGIIKQRQDIVFIFVTKRPERVLQCLRQDVPLDNIWFHVTCENQECADERIPILLDLPFVHKGVMVAPFVGKVSIAQYLATGQIENVWAGGENYDGARPLFYSWVKLLSDECKNFDVSFSFFETGNVFIKDNKKIVFKDKIEQTKFAYLENLNYESSKQQKFNLLNSSENTQLGLFEQEHSTPFYKPHCQYCLQKKWCVGCSNCGKCSCS